MNSLITLLLVGLSVGLGNFAASVAIGLGGVSQSLRMRVALTFGLFETGMPIIGLLIGNQIAGELGGKANIVGGLLLGLTGAYLIISALRNIDNTEVQKASHSWGKLLIAGLSLSIDNLIIGFSLGTRHQPLLLAALIIGITSIAMSLLGLQIGNKLSNKIEKYSEFVSGLILMMLGLAIGFKLL
jgi:putative Mn2+ efflux pump MntP